jgi:hypothetical protein
MKAIQLYIVSFAIFFSTDSFSKEWAKECVGYYAFDIPKNVETALYVVKNITSPPNEPISKNKILLQRTRNPVITFGNAVYENGNDRIQAQFSEFFYSNYEIGVSTKDSNDIDFGAYRKKVESDYVFSASTKKLQEKRRFEVLQKPETPDEEFRRRHDFIIKDYNNAFAVYDFRGYTVQINNIDRLYQFWGGMDEYKNDKAQTAETQWRKKEPEVKSLLSRFSPRELYEIPNEQGFCIPYGFIANDSGQETHNMAVTYRLKAHPDVSILFQTLTADPGPGDNRPNTEMSEKDYVTDFLNNIYGHSFRDIKLYGKGFTYPEVDGRKAVAAFTKFTRFDKTVDYGYVAYVKGKSPIEPTLMFYLIRRGSLATGSAPVDKKDLEKMAEHIVASIKHRQVDNHFAGAAPE